MLIVRALLHYTQAKKKFVVTIYSHYPAHLRDKLLFLAFNIW